MPPARLMVEVQAVQPWAATTIKTLLARLIHKQAVAAERTDSAVHYHPLLAREDYVSAEVEALTARLFGGDDAALLAWLKARRIQRILSA